MSAFGTALRDRELSTSAKLVFCALLEMESNHPSREVHEVDVRPSQVAMTVKELSAICNIHEKTVSKSLKELTHRGFIRAIWKQRFHFCSFRERVYEIVALEKNLQLN